MPRKIQPFQIKMATARVGLEIGPRYARPLDNTVVWEVFHDTTGGGVAVLLDDQDMVKVMNWLTDEDLPWDGDLEFRQPQTTMVLHKRVHNMTQDEVLDIRISWNGSGRAMEMTALGTQVDDLSKFIARAILGEWPGWLDPMDVAPQMHGHLYVMGTRQHCRLCVLQGLTDH